MLKWLRAGIVVAAVAAAADHRAVLDEYCVTCHNQPTKTAGLALDKIDLNNLAAGAETWEKVIRKVRVGMMPPQGNPRPDESARKALVAYLLLSLALFGVKFVTDILMA